jgi:glucose uptake protein GlcU
MLSLIGGVIGLIIRIVGAIMEANAEKKKLKQEAVNDLQQAIVKRDPSAITASFDKFNRVR